MKIQTKQIQLLKYTENNIRNIKITNNLTIRFKNIFTSKKNCSIVVKAKENKPKVAVYFEEKKRYDNG